MSTLLGDVFLVVSIPLTLVYVVVPLLFTFAPDFMQHVFFLSFVANPFVNFADLAANGVWSRGRNFFLKDGKKVDQLNDSTAADADTNPVIGVWHILPTSISGRFINKSPTDDEIEAQLHTGPEPILIYLHGNSFDRATKHRCDFYNALSVLNFHIIAIDYRGYGNSSGRPTEDGLALDGHSAYNYVRALAPAKPIYLWGHSMGTGVATRVVAELCDGDNGPQGMILESPFNNLYDVVRHHPFSIPLQFLPYFNELIIDPLVRSGLVMNTDVRIGRVKCPILILHAADDQVIPVELARKLVVAAKQFKRQVMYVEFAEEREFKHKFIYRAEELAKVLETFLAECEKAKTAA